MPLKVRHLDKFLLSVPSDWGSTMDPLSQSEPEDKEGTGEQDRGKSEIYQMYHKSLASCLLFVYLLIGCTC